MVTSILMALGSKHKSIIKIIKSKHLKLKIMKNYILFLILITVSITINAQTTWIGTGENTNWNTTGNWNTNVVPTATNDVIIPSGFTVTLNVVGNIKSIDIQGNSVFEMNANLTFTEPSTFGANTTVNWANGTINGTSSTLTNLGTMNTTSTGAHFIAGDTTLENQGIINLTSSGNLIINTAESIINNTVGGIIDLQADSGDITGFNGTGILNNEGIIKRTSSNGEAIISVFLNNNDGTIQVEAGTLSFTSQDKTLTDGAYNVFADATMNWSVTIIPLGTIEGTVMGNLNWNDDVFIPIGETATFNFSEIDNFNWTQGNLTGGGTLINANVITLTSTNANVHFITNETTLDNLGTLNITTSEDLVINNGSTLNNPVGAVIDMQADSGNIRWFSGAEGVLNNEGLIKKTTSSGEAQISLQLNNNDGTIQVEAGTLSFQGSFDKNFTDGTYNVFSGAIMAWDTPISPSGVIEGTIAGDLNWNDEVIIPTGETATFNFSETDNFNWMSGGSLDGGGTLINSNVLSLTNTLTHTINEGSVLENQGILNLTSVGDLVLNEGSVLNNPIGGVIDMQADSGNIRWFTGADSVLNNAGLIKRSTTTGVAEIELELNNSGTISLESGELKLTNDFTFTNETSGIIKGIGVFGLPSAANYSNNGTFAPGLSPGILTVDGDFVSSAAAILDIELNGSVQGTEYDLLTILGNASLNGNVNVTMGFEPQLNDEFIIATTSELITECGLTNTTSASFNGNQYNFDVICRNDNEVVLTVSEILGVNDLELATVNLYPNPTNGIIHLDLDTTYDGINISISNILGQVITYERFVNTDTIDLTIDGSPGIYFVNVNTSNGSQKTFKIIKK